MSELFRALGAASSWGAVAAFVLVSALVLFAGAALGVALFARDATRAKRAQRILGDLLELLPRRAR